MSTFCTIIFEQINDDDDDYCKTFHKLPMLPLQLLLSISVILLLIDINIDYC